MRGNSSQPISHDTWSEPPIKRSCFPGAALLLSSIHYPSTASRKLPHLVTILHVSDLAPKRSRVLPIEIERLMRQTSESQMASKMMQDCLWASVTVNHGAT